MNEAARSDEILPRTSESAPWRASGLLLAVTLVLLAYWPSLSGYFVSDDFVLIERALADGIFTVWGEAEGGFLRPLIGLLFELDAKLWGLDPLGYRVTNLMLHLVTGLLVSRFVSRLARPLDDGRGTTERSVAAGRLAGALFLVHPSHGEAVAWIAGRTDLTSTLFQVAGLIAVLSFLDRGTAGSYATAMASFVLALGAKESALPWPGIVIAVGGLVLYTTAEVGDRRLRSRRLGAMVAGTVLVLVVYFIARRWLLGVWLGGYGTQRHLDFDVLATAQRIGRYIVRSVLPGTAETAAVAIPFLVSTVVVAMIWTIVRRRTMAAPLVAMGLAFSCSLVTASTFLDVDLGSPRGERFLYLPTVFICAAVAWMIVDRAPSERLRSVAGWGTVLVAASPLVAGMPAWHQAAETSRALVAVGNERFTDETVLWLTHLPAEQNGRFVLQNGYRAALRLTGTTAPRAAVPLALIATVGPGSGARAVIREEASTAVVTLDLEPGAWISETRLPVGWQAEVIDDERVVLTGVVPRGVVLASLGEM